MKNFLIVLLCFPYLIYSQEGSSYEELMDAKDQLNQDMVDLEEWYSEQEAEFYLKIYLKDEVDLNKWIQNYVASKINLDSIYYVSDIYQEIWFAEHEGDIIEGLLDLDNDVQIEEYWWDESEEDEINSVYFEDLEEIEISIGGINTYLTLKNIQDNDIYYDNKIPLDTGLGFNWGSGLLVECDSFGMEEWIGNWISEGVDPGEASIYENWYIIFNIVSDLDMNTFYMPLIIEHCNYNESDKIMMCGDQEIKIGYEYIIKNISTEQGERGNGIIFVTEDIEELW